MIETLREALDALQPPKRYENDRNGNWWTTDMEYGWEIGVEDASAAALAATEPGLDVELPPSDPTLIEGTPENKAWHREHAARLSGREP